MPRAKSVKPSNLLLKPDTDCVDTTPQHITVKFILASNMLHTTCDLDRCPFCGSKADIQEGGNGLYPSYNVVCKNKKCGASSGSTNTIKKAISLWNTRKAINNTDTVCTKLEPTIGSLPGNLLFKPHIRHNKPHHPVDLEGQMVFDFISDISNI